MILRKSFYKENQIQESSTISSQGIQIVADVVFGCSGRKQNKCERHLRLNIQNVMVKSMNVCDQTVSNIETSTETYSAYLKLSLGVGGFVNALNSIKTNVEVNAKKLNQLKNRKLFGR